MDPSGEQTGLPQTPFEQIEEQHSAPLAHLVPSGEHMFMQLWPQIVPTSLTQRPSHWPLQQKSSVAQIFATHGSQVGESGVALSTQIPCAQLPCAVQVPFVHRLEQHCMFDWQVVPSGAQVAFPQRPPLQAMEQQSFGLLQGTPSGEQVLLPQRPFGPQMPLQHLPVIPHGIPSGTHTGGTTPQMPLGPQTLEQHSLGALHGSPSGEHTGGTTPHRPVGPHTLEQQSLGFPHSAPSIEHGGGGGSSPPQRPIGLQKLEQHSVELAHGSPSIVQREPSGPASPGPASPGPASALDVMSSMSDERPPQPAARKVTPIGAARSTDNQAARGREAMVRERITTSPPGWTSRPRCAERREAVRQSSCQSPRPSPRLSPCQSPWRSDLRILSTTRSICTSPSSARTENVSTPRICAACCTAARSGSEYSWSAEESLTAS